MSDAIRKRDADGQPKENHTETQAIMATNEDNLAGRLREKLKGFEHQVASDEIEKLIKIVTLIATDETDPNGTEWSVHVSSLEKVGVTWIKMYFCKGWPDLVVKTGLDHDRRIAKLLIDVTRIRNPDLLVLQDVIGCLEQLEELDVEGCLSFPIQPLSKLPKLKMLSFNGCPRALASSLGELSKLPKLEHLSLRFRSRESFVDELARMRLTNLKVLSIEEGCLPLGVSLFRWINKHFPSLEELKIWNIDIMNEETTVLPDVFSLNNAMTFHESLSSISIRSCGMDEGHLEILLFDVLPKFPMVSSLDLRYNCIKSFRSIEQRINKIDNDGLEFKLALQSIDLYCNPIESLLEHDKPIFQASDSEEIGAVCRFLRAAPTIQKLKAGKVNYNEQIGLELFLNRAGRQLFGGSVNDLPLPLSLWPAVLERATQSPIKRKSGDDLGQGPSEDYITFYLLRNGLAPLIGMATNEDKLPGGITENLPGGIRETFNFVDFVERQKLMKIYALIAMDGCDIDPSGAEFRNAAIWDWYLEREGKSDDLYLDLRFDRNSMALSDAVHYKIGFCATRDDYCEIKALQLNLCGYFRENLCGHSRDLLVLRDTIGCLKHLEEFCIINFSLSFPIQLLSKLPKLKKLSLDCMCKNESIPDVFNFTNPMISHQNLRSITLDDCKMDEGQLERILFDVLPNFPMVSSLDVRNNRIKSFRSIEKRLNKMDSDGLVFKLGLREIELYQNPILGKNSLIGTRKQSLIGASFINSKEVGAVCRFLHAVPTLQKLDAGLYYFHDQIVLELILNWAGRRFFDGSVNGHPLPLTLWPTILERVNFETSGWTLRPRISLCNVRGSRHVHFITALFYMLRNGPVLFVGRNRSEG